MDMYYSMTTGVMTRNQKAQNVWFCVATYHHKHKLEMFTCDLSEQTLKAHRQHQEGW